MTIRKKSYSTWLIAVITLFVGMNLRPIMASVSPIIPVLRQALGLNNQIAGLLTTLPVIMMGIFALFTPMLGGRISERTGVLIGLSAIAGASVSRLIAYSSFWLLTTAVVGGIGIAMIQTLMPAYIKRIKPEQSSTLMALFTTGIMAGAAMASAVSSPLEHMLGWQMALSFMTLPAVIAIILCTVAMPSIERQDNQAVPLPYQCKNAWLLMLFFGIGTGAYTLVLAWLPLNYIQLGWNRTASGLMLSVLTISQVVAGLLVSRFIAHFTDRRQPLFMTLCLILVGLIWLIVMPSFFAYLAVIVLGLGIGALFPLSLIVTLDYAKDASQAVSLLAFVQGGGYLIASVFPVIAGVVIDAYSSLTGAWMGMAVGVVFLLMLSRRFSPNGFGVNFKSLDF